ncbi:MAG: DNA polymerase IV, partial [Pedobacter sp.]
LDLRQQTEAFLVRHFGKVGHHYYSIARAIDHRPVQPNRVRKSVGSETTFAEDLLLQSDLIDALQPLIESVWNYCERTSSRGRTITLKVKYADFTQITRSRTSPGIIMHESHVRQVASDLLGAIFPLPKGVRLLGLSLSNFQINDRPESGQLSLEL